MRQRSLIFLAVLLGACRDHRIIQPTLALPRPTVLADSAIGGRVALAHGRLADFFDRSRTAPERDTARISFVLPAYLVLDRDARVAARSWGPEASVVRSALDSLLSRPGA
jgi:hypothetical protein